uniref:DNA-(apurinic or apyrimidinic site) endonuclease n=1 Tax=Meloidogyne hapla TaxID=6305 RepID=A0A1I8C033_MELHA
MPPKKKIITKRTAAVTQSIASSKVTVGSTLSQYNVLTTSEMENMAHKIAPKAKSVSKKQITSLSKTKCLVMSDNSQSKEVKEKHLAECSDCKEKFGKKEVEINGTNNLKNKKKEVEKTVKKSVATKTVIKSQAKNVRSTRASKQNDQGTSNDNGGSNGNEDETEEEEQEKEKVPKKRKHFPVFEKNSGSHKDKKFKKGQPLKIWTWNVAGLRANVKKNGHLKIKESGADLVSLQETKCPEIPPEIESLDEYCFKKLAGSTKNGGQAGVAMLAKEVPIKVITGIGDKDFDTFGRYIEAEYENFFFISIYVPNSGAGLVNLPARGRWDQMLLIRVTDLDKRKPVIIAGDMNVAHQEIDLRNPDANRNKSAGFTDQEREAFTRLLEAGFVDVWRSRNPDVAEAYTYWSYIGSRRAKNIGWRLDYFVISERLLEKVIECEIHSDITGTLHGSDHCPLSLVIDI